MAIYFANIVKNKPDPRKFCINHFGNVVNFAGIPKL